MKLEDIPGYEPGNRKRNVVVTVGYAFLFLMILGAVGGDDTDESSAEPTTETTTEEVETAEETQETEEVVTETPEAVEQKTEEETEAPPTTEEDTTPDVEELRAALEGQGVTVTDVERDGDTVHVSYITVETTQQDIAEEMGTVAGTYMAFIAEGDDSQQLEVTILDATEKPIGDYHVERSWAEAGNSGDMTHEEVAMEVLKTLETRE